MEFRVIGTVAAQGSKRYVGNGISIESSKKVAPWRQDVAREAKDAVDACGWQPPAEAQVTVVFLFRRPKHHYRTGRNSHLLRDNAPYWHNQKPDVDKCQRSTFDALTTAGALADDCRIVQVRAEKVWAAADEPTGALIQISSEPKRYEGLHKS